MSNYSNNFFEGFDGIKLFKQEWTSIESKAKLIFIHGYTEHSSRYQEFAQFLNKNQIDFYCYDQRGYGKSEGRRAYVNRFEDYLKDLHLYINDHVPKDKPLLLMGHSMGGLIALKYTLQYPDLFKGVISSASALQISKEISPFLQKISGILSLILPKLKTIKLDTSALSRDKNEVEKYKNDPLIYHEGTYARTGAEMLKATKTVQQEFKKFITPVLIIHGTDDRLADIEGSKRFHEFCSSNEKQLVAYEGFYHELLFELDRGRVMEDILNWILKQLQRNQIAETAARL